MRKAVLAGVAVLVVTCAVPASAAKVDGAVVFGPERAHVYAGAPLVAAGADSVTAVKTYLRSRGVSAATADSIRPAGSYTSRLSGVRHLRFTQEIGGLRVVGAYVRAAFSARGELVHLMENLADAGAVAAAAATPEQALSATLGRVHPRLAERPSVAARAGTLTTFARTPFFHAAPTAERVAVALASGGLRAGYLVETWSRDTNELHHTVVGGGGDVLAVERRTSGDSYNVFTEDPDKTPQAVVAGPGAGNAFSPAGWLFAGDQLSTNIAGNNVNAYLDVNANNRPDRGGTAVADGNFLTAANLAQEPSTAQNQAVAVQNLFFLNNVLHDRLYEVGFTEETQNFQEDNFGVGGVGSDSVNAEAHDGEGTDNANFATPTDGRNPRMQMFLWTGAGPTHEVVVGASSFTGADASWGRPLDTTGLTGEIRLVNDGVAPSTSDGCEPLARRSFTAAIALVDRGTCNFTVKAANAQNAGAIGIIVVNNVPGEPVPMGGEANLRISGLMISQADGDTLKGLVPVAGTMRRLAVQPLMIDGTLDFDIVAHEYGHGLTWRMIGGMSGPLAGAAGEGASDVLAFLLNGDDRIAEYSFSNPGGLRREPYTNYSRTYGDVTGDEVHDDGEIYAAAMWRLHEYFAANGWTDQDLLATFVDGMNYMLATPDFEAMRDGLIASVVNRPAALSQRCLIWQAFADYGIGEGADGVANADGSVTVTESFTVPAICQP